MTNEILQEIELLKNNKTFLASEMTLICLDKNKRVFSYPALNLDDVLSSLISGRKKHEFCILQKKENDFVIICSSEVDILRKNNRYKLEVLSKFKVNTIESRQLLPIIRYIVTNKIRPNNYRIFQRVNFWRPIAGKLVVES